MMNKEEFLSEKFYSGEYILRRVYYGEYIMGEYISGESQCHHHGIKPQARVA
jgi:hypothetical protein